MSLGLRNELPKFYLQRTASDEGRMECGQGLFQA